MKITLISVGLVFLLAVACFYAINNTKAPAAVAAPAVDVSPELRTEFNGVLERFLKSVEEKMQEYKTERKVLVEALGPLNLRAPEYVQENHDMIQQQIIPSLRVRMNDILQSFEQADRDVERLLIDKPADVQQFIRTEWAGLKDGQGKMYKDYFALEHEMLTAYSGLIIFYYAKRYEFEADVEAKKIVFKNPTDEAEERIHKQRITELYAKEDLIFESEARPSVQAAPVEAAP